MSDAELDALAQKTEAEFADFRARGLKLDMTRGKPAPEQLDLSSEMLALPANRDFTTRDERMRATMAACRGCRRFANSSARWSERPPRRSSWVRMRASQ
jgi:hypothetical protein